MDHNMRRDLSLDIMKEQPRMLFSRHDCSLYVQFFMTLRGDSEHNVNENKDPIPLQLLAMGPGVNVWLWRGAGTGVMNAFPCQGIAAPYKRQHSCYLAKERLLVWTYSTQFSTTGCEDKRGNI